MLTDTLRGYWQAADLNSIGDLYGPDALLDIYVPTDRMQYRGRDAIVQFWQLDFGSPRQFRFLHWVEHRSPWGSVIETAAIDEPTGEYYRWVNLLFIVDGQITQHVVYCTGVWSAAAARRWEPDTDTALRSRLSTRSLVGAA